MFIKVYLKKRDFSLFKYILYWKSIIIVMAMFFLACEKIDDKDIKMEKNKLDSSLKLIQDKKIFFGHQSVGQNIISGLEDLCVKLSDCKLNVMTIDDYTEQHESFFLHARIGRNANPYEKCDDFSTYLRTYELKNFDIALMKFCYVDINLETDILALFNYYNRKIEILQEKYPNLIFIHVTVPLVEENNFWKKTLLKLSGKADNVALQNINREKFNNILRQKYKHLAIYDLARIESTFSDGKRNEYSYNGEVYYSMINEYTSDGGHLNDLGEELSAIGLIEAISEEIRKREMQ